MTDSEAQHASRSSSDRVWFITGATSGIGRELALAALGQGDRVAAAARNTEVIGELAEQFDGRLLALQADVGDEDAVRHAVRLAVGAFGRIDVIANNAGYGLYGAVEEATDAQAHAIFQTNFFGVLNVLRAALPVLRAQGSGHILQGSSDYGQSARSGVGLVAATKYALEGLSDALVDEVRPLGIKVTIVEPGPMATTFGAHGDVAAPIPDYDGTVRSASRTAASPSDALIDPARAATAMVAVVDVDEPPLRLAIGGVAADRIRAALTARVADLDNWSALTHSVDV